ncbi:aminoacyl-tRNA deacylase [Microbacterium amylolyticum]|uniref:Cys-tRNA(Pro) deacylase n=1 Tax=Microbacterium amylolyticum TaxID=936337 RepID=A0ABS4ZHW8_9MICO|nr:YbaK/EbsC family protein [Microbacterium amylolyticum]MBP2436865.1 Cys-tRNA(Pro) deacylase [Microbacterium amylolyticum]
MTDPTQRVRDAAARRGVDIEIRESPPASSLEEAATLRGIDPSDIVKTLVVKGKGDQFLFVLVPGDRAISWTKLRKTVGVNKLRLPDADQALDATGYVRGTIVPFGSTTEWPVYADERMKGKRISMGAGAHGHTLFVDADSLLASYDATVADITEPIDVIR